MAKKRKRKPFKLSNLIYFSAVIVVVFVIGFIGIKDKLIDGKMAEREAVTVDRLSPLAVTFIDIGQGDAIFINLPDGKNMLIDFGAGDKSAVDEYLKTDGKPCTIDYLVATHPDSDHIGNLPYIYQNYEVKYSYRPYVYSGYEQSSAFPEEFNAGAKISQKTKIYYQYLDSVYKYNPNSWEFFCDESDFGAKFSLDGKTYSYNVDFLMPYAKTPSDFSSFKTPNNFSAIIMLEFAGRKILFMGDAEYDSSGKGAEDKFVESLIGNEDLADCDVLKVGHHGSDTSSSKRFLQLCKPEYAVISCFAKGNNYGHPKRETLDNIIDIQRELSQDAKTGLYRTDLQGSITLTVDLDGNMTFKTETSENDEYLLKDGEFILSVADEITATKEKARNN